MNILNKIKNKWDFSKSVEQNAICFNTRENAERKYRKKMILFAIFVVAIATFFHNPLLGMAMMIGAITYGSEYVFNSAETRMTSIVALDSTHFVITYKDLGNSNYGTAIFGTISGTSISYGSEAVFNSANTEYTAVAKIDSTHFIVAYQDTGNGSDGTARIGTVSGTTITYGGSEVVFDTSNSSYIAISRIDSTHFVISYRESNGYSIIATVSGNSISFGTRSAFNSAASYNISNALLDSTHFVVSYEDGGNSERGTATIGTISGTTITYGSEYVFNNAQTAGTSVAVLDSTHFIVAYNDQANLSRGTAIIGTVSNTDEIAYGSEYIFSTGQGNSTGWIDVTAIDDSNAVITYYRYTGSIFAGHARTASISGSTITYGDESTFNNATSLDIHSDMLDSTNLVIVYRDSGNSSYGTGILGDVPAAGIEYFKTCSETIAINDTLLNKTSKVFSEALSIVDSISVQKTLKRTLSETITIVDNINAKKIAVKTLSEIIFIADTIKKSVGKVLAETITIIDSIIFGKVFARTYSEVITIVDSIVITQLKTLSEVISIFDTIAKKTSQILNEAIIIVDNITTRKISNKTLSDVITIVDTVKSKTARTLSEVVTIADSISKITAQVLLETITLVESLYIKLNGVNVKWVRKYSEKVGSFTRKYSEKVGTFIKKYYKDI